jgi:tRNA A37 threonylcarbamoyltransferase TsaD
MSIVARDQGGNIVDAFTPSTSQVFAVGNTTAQSTAFGLNTTLVRVSCSLGHCHVAFGANPTASITTSMMISNNSTSIFRVNAGDKMAYIKDAAVTSSTVCVTELV